MKLPTARGRSTVYIYAEYDDYWAETSEGDEILHRRGDAAHVINEASRYIIESVEPYRLGKGTVLMAEGIYEIEQPIILRDGIHFKGMGEDVTVLREAEQGADIFSARDPDTGSVITLNSGSIKDLSIESNRKTTGGGLLVTGSNQVGNVNNFTIENVAVYGGALETAHWDRVYVNLVGTETEDMPGLRVKNCVFDFRKFGTGGHIKELQLNNANITLIGCRVIGAYVVHGWDNFTPAARNITWIGCNFTDTTIWESASRDSRWNDVFFVGCQFKSVSTGQIYLEEPYEGLFAIVGCNVDMDINSSDAPNLIVAGCKTKTINNYATLGGGRNKIVTGSLIRGEIRLEEVSESIVVGNVLRSDLTTRSIYLDTASGWEMARNVFVGNVVKKQVKVTNAVGLVNSNMLIANVSSGATYVGDPLGEKDIIGSFPPGGSLTSKRFVQTFSGDGTTQDFLIGAHGLYTNQQEDFIAVAVTPLSQDAIAASPATGYLSDEDADGVRESIRVKFSTAPAAGTDNVKVLIYAWRAQPI